MTHSFDQQYWDQIWQSDRAGSMGTSHANPYLTREVGGLTPGTALEAGCGAGAEAIWLAARGWQVTAADIAAEALERAAERAGAAGVAERVQWVKADLSTWNPDTQFDLVTTHYAHPAMPQLEFYDRLAAWVAPGGTLLIVGHLHPDNHGSTTTSGQGRGRAEAHGHGTDAAHDHARDQSHGTAHQRGHAHHAGDQPPASASATAATITARLDPTRWQIITAEESQRTLTGPDGRDTSIHDVVVRASRR